MRLLTHNMLASPVKGIQTSFPLALTVKTIEIKEQELNVDFLRHMIPKLEWEALVEAGNVVRKSSTEPIPEIPQQFNEEMFEDEDIMRNVQRVLLEVYVIEGELTCPSTGRKFPIQNGIPNMLCNGETANTNQSKSSSE
eukprot:c11122_g1_i1.p1 GENE.c11122_g1_i1~~c11122_g1_i1.p1  ORF type:complete len:146 (+),score=61.06 c11122_g1_i1:24-440(+)